MVELMRKSTKILQAMLFCGILMIFAATNANANGGEALYNSYGCAMCHGAGGSGTPAIDPLAETGAEEIYNVSRRGPCEPDLAKLGLPTCMPKYNLSEEDSEAISNYLSGR